MKRVILATRVSSDEQAKGYSLQNQEEALRAFCSKEGHQIVQTYREDHSAKNFNRPEFKKLLQFIRANKGKVDLLLVTTWCRFSRNLTESFKMIERLRGYGVEVQAIEQPLDLSIPENQMILAVYLSLPDIDNRRRSIKITTGVRSAKKEGRWLGQPPFGYKRTWDEKGKPKIEPGPQADLVKKAFAFIAQGKTQAEVRELLKKSGKYFSRSTFSELIRNRVYIGEVRVKEEDGSSYWVKGLHDGLVSADTFSRVQASLEGRLHKLGFVKAKSARPDFPLRGAILCGNCQNPLTGSASKGRNGYHAYYHCNHCHEVRLRAAQVHDHVEAIFGEMKLSKNATALYKLMLSHLLKKQEVEKVRPKEKIEEDLRRNEERSRNIEDDYVDRKIDTETFNRMQLRFKAEREKLQAELAAQTKAESPYQELLKKGLALVGNLPALYGKADIQQKKDILGSIFPEKLLFSKNECRTARINEVLRLILAMDAGFGHKKTGQTFKNLSLSGDVEDTGVEPVTFPPAGGTR
ncbi:recombinase family protein [Flaviaesturariibacter aridisoli]|uniref:Recombinase family protein n=1 Tax=Flaviaesturariibacter aridisoli TaxID=2545761 RepID=A0A4V2WLV2_9BACT|nr:recombinase family protein [Flaviaesturariibacter aridisoli]TCZ64586.1 recombinase family protein [Flaviaesturariibacter aridisoli]